MAIFNPLATGLGGLAATFQDSHLTPTPAVAPEAAPVDSPTIPVSTGPAVVSTGDIHQQAKVNGGKLTDALASLSQNQATNPTPDPTDATDPILAGLTTLQNNSDAATKSLVATTRAAYQNSVNKANSQYENYKRGLQQLGIETGEAESTPDLLSGHIQQAANDQKEKIDALTAEESKTLMDAKNAQDSNDFKTLEDKMTYLQQIKTDKANAIKDMYDGITNASNASAIEAHDVYETFSGLEDSDKQAFIQAVAQKFNFPVASLVTALADEKQKREVDAVDPQNKQRLATEGSSGGGISVKDAFVAITPQLKKVKGSDNYIAPDDYITARDNFRELTGGTFAQFDSEYKDLVNPSSYSKVGIKGTSDDLASQIEAAFPEDSTK